MMVFSYLFTALGQHVQIDDLLFILCDMYLSAVIGIENKEYEKLIKQTQEKASHCSFQLALVYDCFE